MKTKISFLILFILCVPILANAQDTMEYRLRLNVPVFELPQNIALPNNYPSMNQALEWSADMYELSFWGIDALGDKLFIAKTKPYTTGRRISNNVFKYLVGLGFSKYGSELPIPLGVWAHEEFHRSVLGVKDVSSINGNWLFSRWDGTVYGVSDETLEDFKATEINQLLYSYTAGVQYEVLLNQTISVRDFYKQRTLPKTGLLLYNAWYVYDYFRFSASSLSDSVKILAPPHESPDPFERDYAGADLTAWIYDMFNPSLPFTSRDAFPDGEGVNRRLGFSDLSAEEKDYLVKQKQLSLLNFLNPAIFFINRIKINNDLSFNFFAQYAPTHFGNDVAIYLPVKYKNFDLLVNVHNYHNFSGSGFGAGLGLFNYKLSEKIETDFTASFWNQPVSFFETKNSSGGAVRITTNYLLTHTFSGFISVNAKSKGWLIGNPYLESNLSVQAGIKYNLAAKAK